MTEPQTPVGSHARRTLTNVAWLGGAQAIRQVTAILATVLLARFLGPTEFGIFAMMIFVNELAQLLVDFGMGSALIQRKEVNQRLLSTCFWINLAIGAGAALLLALMGPWIAAYFEQPLIRWLVLVSGVNLLIAAASVLPQALLETMLTAALFDVVMLPATLTRSSASMSARQIAKAAFARLNPGGLLIGHLDHVVAPKHLARCLAQGVTMQQVKAWRGFETASRCKTSLSDVGFVSTELYYVEPDMEDPMALVSSMPAAARTHFSRTIRRGQPLYSTVGYWGRTVLTNAGLAGLLQTHLFFWARKPC